MCLSVLNRGLMFVPDFCQSSSFIRCPPVLFLPLSCCVAHHVTSCILSYTGNLRTAKLVQTCALCYQTLLDQMAG